MLALRRLHDVAAARDLGHLFLRKISYVYTKLDRENFPKDKGFCDGCTNVFFRSAMLPISYVPIIDCCF